MRTINCKLLAEKLAHLLPLRAFAPVLLATVAMAAARGGHPPVQRNGVQLLLPGQYRRSAGWPVVKGLPWHELYKGLDGSWHVSPSAVKTRRGRDECVGEEVLIFSPQHEDAVVLFTPFPGLAERPATVAEDRALIPGSTVEFTLGAQRYLLHVEGHVLGEDGTPLDAAQMEQASEEELASQVITDLRLTLVMPDGSRCELAHKDRLEYVLPHLLWGGDLNGDALPDLLLDLADIPESRHCFLFLSDAKDVKCPIKNAAERKVVNDC